MNEFNINKPVQTRDGRTVRVLATDLPGGSGPIAALVGDKILRFYANGQYYLHEQTPRDLVNIRVKKTIEGFLNVYENHGVFHTSLQTAKDRTAPHIVARVPVKIEYTEGEGL